MARPREFCSEKALDGAIDIFWRRGYSGTNLPELLKAMGLTRGSFYAAYTDKHSVFIEALKRYEEVYLSEMLDRLSNKSSEPLEQQLLVLFDQIDTSGPPINRRGCFICNAMVEFGGTDAKIATTVARMSKAIEDALSTAIKNKDRTKDVAQTQAKAVLQLYFGAQTLSKSGDGAFDFLNTIKSIIGKA